MDREQETNQRGSPPPSKKLKLNSGQSLNERLLVQQREGILTDMNITLTTPNFDVIKLRAHKAVLAAMSPVISTMMTERWSNDSAEIEISDVSEEALNIFLEYLYTGNFELNLLVLPEVLKLADLYDVTELIAICDKHFIEELCIDNCGWIYENTKLYTRAQCGKSAYQLITEILPRILSIESNPSNNWAANTWNEILNINYLKDVKEVVLLEGLIRWKDFDPDTRAEDFRKLSKLIRYPLIGAADFAKFVVPLNPRIFDAEEMLQFFTHFHCHGPIPKACQSFEPRSVLEPKTSEELHRAIEKAEPKDIIQLEGTYNGSFQIMKDKITLRGKEGANAIILNQNYSSRAVRAVVINGCMCSVSNLSIISNFKNPSSAIYLTHNCRESTVKNVKITGGQVGIAVGGNDNTLSDITLKEIQLDGVVISGSAHHLTDISVTSYRRDTLGYSCGFTILEGKEHILKNISTNNFNIGLQVKGSDDVSVEGMNFCFDLEYLDIDSEFIGIKIEDCKNASLTDIKCQGECRSIVSGQNVENMKIKNCKSGALEIIGNNHQLEGIDAGEYLRLEGNGHELVDCKAKKLLKRFGAKFKLTNSNFGVQQFLKRKHSI